jgi:formylmethanofuran dehydrogenase subunit E
VDLSESSGTRVAGGSARDPRGLIDAAASPRLRTLLAESAARHAHLCPRQVLGVRMVLLAGETLGLKVPQAHHDKGLLAIVETDGCFTDGIAVAANCHVGRRTMRVEDQGKTAATFVDVSAERALRIRPRLDVRAHVHGYAPDAPDRWTGYVLGYQRMPDDALLEVAQVRLATPLARILSHEQARATCQACGEEIFNEREVLSTGRVLCRACAGGGYLA